MRRTDRLYALVEELRARAPRPVPRAVLAERFEVNVRTIERDILALQSSGVPIWTERGRRGGYAIDARWTLPPLNFDATEALAVIAALTAAPAMPFAEAGRRAQHKILAAMRSEDAAKARDLAGRVRVQYADRPTRGAVLAAIEDAVVERRVVRIEYGDRDGGATTRDVEAHGLHLGGGSAYLLGWCRMRDDARVFRLDRITSVVASDEVAPARDIDSLIDWDDVVAPLTENMTMKQAIRPRGGPPRRADDTTGSSVAFVRAVALGLPQVKNDGGVFVVRGKPFVQMESEERALLRTDPRGRELSEDNAAELTVRRTGRDTMREAVEAAWRLAAPARAASEFVPVRKAGISRADVRRLVSTFPRAVVGQPRGGRVEFSIEGTKKRSTFAWLGQVNNLLPPDDADALLVRLTVEDREALTSEHPERFFSTPHYTSGVCTRLSENGPEDLEELWELLAGAWEQQAPPGLAEQLDVSKAKSRALKGRR